ncbi:hypothetical protein [Streptomyces sp. Root55]|uniref:hypothetical protein n=1 Tax=Streptomyces sp. Root55 TaxID=1736554 RepID=UPI001F5B3986|nr:hypothetical protein [Streptomyces sp. Root55]
MRHGPYQHFATALPWSAEPMPGWEGKQQLRSDYRSSKPDSLGYTDEQRARVAGYRARLVELSTAVSEHPFWETLDRGEVVAARMSLKHVHESVEGVAA